MGSKWVTEPDDDPFAFSLNCKDGIIALLRRWPWPGASGLRRNRFDAIIAPRFAPPLETSLATEKELSDFLRQAEKKAFKRTYYHVRDEDAALDILQDSMIKLCTHYSDKPVDQLPLLFQRILSNTTLDWFRRQKTRNSHFTRLSDFLAPDASDDFDLLDIQSGPGANSLTESAEQWTGRLQTLQQIESAIMGLPGRQREAFLLRYWEEMDVAETAAVMGCTEGSVKTHCSRAIQALHKVLTEKGMKP